MSACAISLYRISRASAAFRFSVTLFTPRLLVSKYVLGRPGRTVEPRELSPTSGTSILITSAPRSAISMYGTVPACAVEQATTFTPCKGPCGSVMSNNLPPGQHGRHRTEQALRQKDDEQYQQSAVDQIIPVNGRCAEPNTQCLGQHDCDCRTDGRPQWHVESTNHGGEHHLVTIPQCRSPCRAR